MNILVAYLKEELKSGIGRRTFGILIDEGSDTTSTELPGLVI